MRRAWLGLLAAALAVAALPERPADAATDPLCERFQTCPQSAGAFTLTPSPQAMNVAWEVTAPSTTICASDTMNGSFTWQQCPLVGYRVISTFDPVTKTGNATCVTIDLARPNCTFTGLVNGVQYQYSVQAVYAVFGSTPLTQNLPSYGSNVYNPNSEGRRYAPWSGPSQPKAPCCDLPQAPTAVTASILRNAVDVAWSAPASWGGAPELTYTVTTTPADASCTTVGLTCRLEGLRYGQTYAISVTGANSAGSSPPAAAVAAIPTGPPDAPTVTRVAYLPGGRARVSWTSPDSDGGSAVTRFTVRSTPSQRTCSAPATRTSCEITGLSSGRGYAFSVTATNARGTSVPSAPKAAGVLVGPASRPRDLRASLSGTTATVSWRPPSDNGGGRVLSYVVQSSPSGLGCTTAKLSCAIPDLARGRSYTFSVYAVNTSGRGQSATSNAVLAPVPIAPAPTTPDAPPKGEAPID